MHPCPHDACPGTESLDLEVGGILPSNLELIAVGLEELPSHPMHRLRARLLSRAACQAAYAQPHNNFLDSGICPRI